MRWTTFAKYPAPYPRLPRYISAQADTADEVLDEKPRFRAARMDPERRPESP